MALPKIDKPLFEDKLPYTNKEVYYRAFTVREEKILIIGRESDDIKQGMLAMQQVVNNCVTYKDGSEFDVRVLPVFEMEYLIMKIQSKSVDNVISLTITDEDTNKPIEVELDLDKAKMVENPEHTNKIKLNDDYTLVLKLPTVEMMDHYTDLEIPEVQRTFEIMVRCMDKIVTEDEIFSFEGESDDEIIQFLDDLDPKNLEDIKKFFETAPKLRHEITYTNANGDEKTLVIEGTESFFE